MKRYEKIIIGVLAALTLVVGTYRVTMLNLEIETDGDAAIVTVFGQSDLYRIN